MRSINRSDERVAGRLGGATDPVFICPPAHTPPHRVEEMILRMKVVTPASGTMELSATQAPELFQLAKVRRNEGGRGEKAML